MTPDDAVISCERVTKRYGSVVALDGLDLTVRAGTIVGYLGPNGAGKSTTIRILLDVARRDSGVITVLGSDPQTSSPALRARIGYLPGELRLDDRLRVDDTLRSWARLRGGGVEQAYVDELCRRLDLDVTRENRGLSSGNRRKVGLVGALMARPELLVLDEPTGGVDPLVQEAFLSLITEARDEGRTVFLSSHVLSEVERVADEVVVIRSGQVVATGNVDELRQAARQPFTIWFSSGPPPVSELASTPGVSELAARGVEVTGVVEGSPTPLLKVLAGHDIDHLLMPEPDLEAAFLRYYQDDGADAR